MLDQVQNVAENIKVYLWKNPFKKIETTVNPSANSDSRSNLITYLWFKIRIIVNLSGRKLF